MLEREGCPIAGKGREREREPRAPLLGGPLGIDFGLLEEGLSPSAHGLGPSFGYLFVYMHACLHAILLDFSLAKDAMCACPHNLHVLMPYVHP